jgi:hypothetical protein
MKQIIQENFEKMKEFAKQENISTYFKSLAKPPTSPFNSKRKPIGTKLKLYSLKPAFRMLIHFEVFMPFDLSIYDKEKRQLKILDQILYPTEEQEKIILENGGGVIFYNFVDVLLITTAEYKIQNTQKKREKLDSFSWYLEEYSRLEHSSFIKHDCSVINEYYHNRGMESPLSKVEKICYEPSFLNYSDALGLPITMLKRLDLSAKFPNIEVKVSASDLFLDAVLVAGGHTFALNKWDLNYLNEGHYGYVLLDEGNFFFLTEDRLKKLEQFKQDVKKYMEFKNRFEEARFQYLLLSNKGI